MRHLNPYVHTCADQPGLVCPACKWAEERQTAEVLVYNEGTIWLFNPLFERAKAWVAEHVAAEQRWELAAPERERAEKIIRPDDNEFVSVCRKLEKLTRLLAAADRIRAARQASPAQALAAAAGTSR